MATKFPSVTLQGNILTFEALEKIAAGKDDGDMPRQTAREYGFASEQELRSEIQGQWAVAKTQYTAFQQQVERLKDSEPGTTKTRSGWMIPLLSLLGHDLRYQAKAQEIDGRAYAISHVASATAETGFGEIEDSRKQSRKTDAPSTNFPVHIVGANQSLDRRGEGMRMSPHALVQEFLNRHESLYAIVTNGKSLRLLRDSANLTKLSYVEFDLTRLFGEDLFTDFALLYRLLHISRLPEEPTAGADSILEKYHQEALKSGSRIRSKLSEAVERGIVMLANGLLANADNHALRQWAAEQPDAPAAYYEALLKLIYRLLFVMVIEERDLIFPPPETRADDGLDGLRGPQPMAHRDVYYQFYSLKRLRGLALNHRLANAREYDLWESLRNTFALFEPGGTGAKLGIGPLAGSLFGTQALSALQGGRVNNRVLLECLRGLSQFDNGQGGVMPVNYASLDVEEFGSVYEGLLEYAPHIDPKTLEFRFVKGQDRSSSGSHYTPDELVQPLIKHSLEHLIADRTVAPDAAEPKREAAIQQLLQLKVTDVTCGSGHILLAAARRIGLEVSRLRSQEEQPNPMAIREGTRDAIQRCIYGVDRNPLAVELCKVALWLEAHVPGRPLGFLDHRIKCGDAIVGVGHLEDLQKGIPTEAFKTFTSEEKSLGAALRKRNQKERKDREARVGGDYQTNLLSEQFSVKDRLAAFRQNFARFAEMPERTVAEIEEKEAAYRKLSQGSNWWFIKTLCDVQIAQFFIPKTDDKRVVTDSRFFEMMRGARDTQAEGAAVSESSERRFFHWFLEFPEVFAGGGFDCVLGNPPFLGGLKIPDKIDEIAHEYLQSMFHASGRADLVSYFFRRTYTLIGSAGKISLLATNTISQGDTRIAGLQSILKLGGVINFAIPSIVWPGAAEVRVASVSLSTKSGASAKKYIGSSEVTFISSYLDSAPELHPYKIKSNKNESFQGDNVAGLGFSITRSEVKTMIESDPKNEQVLFPYIDGDTLNKSPEMVTENYIISFGERTESDAISFKEPYRKLIKDVYPERQTKNAKKYPRMVYEWWKFWNYRKELHRQLDNLDEVLCVARVSRTLAFAVVNAKQVFHEKLVVMTRSLDETFPVLQSDFHNYWAWKYCTTMKDDLTYTSSAIYQTFPFPEANLFKLVESGCFFRSKRREDLLLLSLGLTKLYNQFHNAHLTTDYDTLWSDGTLTIAPAELKKRKQSKETYNLYRHLDKTPGTISMGEAVERIAELRRLHKEMDQAVLAAYGWDKPGRYWGPAIRLRHDFHEVDYLPDNDNVRYTIHPEARREVLKRLLLLNHEIHAAEVRGVEYEVVRGEKIRQLMREQVEALYPYVDRLHERTVTFLSSAEESFAGVEQTLAKSYKGYVSELSSALENELAERVFVAFDAEFQGRYRKEDGTREAYLDAQAAIDPQKLGKFTGLLKKRSTKYELGTMEYLLSLVYKETGSTLRSSELLQDFRAFVLREVGIGVLDRGFLDELKGYAARYRNEAVHLGEVSKVEAEACREVVLGLLGVVANQHLSR